MDAVDQVAANAAKDSSVQALRGIAVLLMVAGHVIGSSAARGMRVDDDSAWRWFYLCFEDIRMPLFTVLSGYVYARRPVASFSGYPGLVRGKSRRLLGPFVTVGLMLFAMQYLTPGANLKISLSDFPKFFLAPSDFGHLWFLQSLFLIFLTIAALDPAGISTTFRGWLVATIVASCVFVAVRVPPNHDYLSINGYFRLLPFFLIGYGMYRYRVLDLRDRALAIGLCLFVTAYAVRIVDLVEHWHLSDFWDRAIALAVGVMGVSLIFSGRSLVNWRTLSWLGGFSFGIYLLHVFGSAASRIALRKVGIDEGVLVFIVGLFAGVAVPIAFQLIFGRWNAVRVSILGEKPVIGREVGDDHRWRSKRFHRMQSLDGRIS
ncbi:acyltransferase family protein [Gordonia sp. NPDC003424]